MDEKENRPGDSSNSGILKNECVCGLVLMNFVSLSLVVIMNSNLRLTDTKETHKVNPGARGSARGLSAFNRQL